MNLDFAGVTRRLLALCLYASMALAAACGGDEESDNNAKSDLCALSICTTGVCDPGTGDCVNPAICDEDAICLDGFECVASQCREKGLCADVTCARGVCEAATGECVDAEICTTATEATDCLAGSICLNGQCAGEAAYCDQQVCDRGVCDFENLGCGNADTCTGDMECLEGFYCGDEGSCVANVCDADMVDCARGVCEATTGECINADSCTDLDGCIDGFFCIGNACVPESEACGECDGNQVCEYVSGSMTTTCSENPSGCVTSVDCVDDRACRNARCGAAPMCEPDGFEPNEDAMTAVDIFGLRLEGTRIDSTICDTTDVDVFAYDVREDPLFTGTLLADVKFKAEDIGLGELSLELLDPRGQSVGTATTSNGYGRIEATVGVLAQGVFVLKVTGAQGLSTAGIRYGVFMDLLDPETVDACTNAPAIQATNSGDSASGDSATLAPSCSSNAAAGEDIYLLELDRTQIVSLTLSGTTSHTISIREECEVAPSEVYCASDKFNGLLNAGTYYVVVQSETSTGTYSLAYEALTPLCTPADNVCIDADTAQVCSPLGDRVTTETCDAGCDDAIRGCTRLATDVCLTAVDASAGYSGTVAFDDLEGDYSVGSTCVPQGLDATDGADAAFQIDVPAGEAVYATISGSQYDLYSLYFLRDCDNASNSCFGGKAADGGVTVAYTNSSADAETLFLIADAEDGFSIDDGALEIVVGPVVCTPGAATCNADELSTCNVAGNGYVTQMCNYGCDATNGICVPPAHDVCGSGAIDATAGGQFTGVIGDFQNDYSLSSSGCTGYSSNGRDAVYVINGTPGDVINASLNATFDSVLYAVTSCSDLSTCEAGSDSGNPEEIQFVLETSPTYLIVDAYSASSTGTYTLDVTVRTPDCTTPGEILGCADITTLNYCDQYGFTTPYTCGGDCAAGACSMPTGDICFDPVVLSTAGGMFSGSFGDYSNDLDPGYGTCILLPTSDQDGPDSIFAIDMTAGETITATLTTTDSSAGMYILESCGDAADSCLWAKPRSKTLDFFSPVSKRYYLVVDSTNAFTTATFDLAITNRYTDVCQPGGASCDSASGVLTVCAEDGSAVARTVACANGCEGQYCKEASPANDTCATADVITASTIYFDDFDRFNADYNPGSSSCLSKAALGPDAVYQIALNAGEVVTVDVKALDTSTAPSVYFVTDCADVATSCLSGAFEVGGTEIFTGYYSASGGTVYAIVDAEFSYDDGPFIVDFNIKPADCTPGNNTCLSADTLQTCTDFGVFADQSCYFGCTNGACDAPGNDLCAGAIDAGAGGNFQGPIELFANDYDPTASGCTGYAAPGPDAVYSVTVNAGDYVYASLDGDIDGSLYAVTDCADVVTSCVDGSEGFYEGGTEEIAFSAPTAGTYFIIVDGFSATEEGTFDLNIIAGPPICTPRQGECSDGTQLQICNAGGNAYETETFSCETACTIGEPTCDGTGDLCFEAIDATAGGMFTGTFDGFEDDYDLYYPNCTGADAPGPDVVYYVDLQANQTLTATLTATDSTQDTSLYFITDCVQFLDLVCVSGEDTVGTGETVTYTATQAERIYIVADNYDYAFELPTTPTYSLNVQIQ